MDEPSDWVVLTQRLGYCPEGWVKYLTQLLGENNGWVKYLTQLLVENNPACVLSNIYPALGCI